LWKAHFLRAVHFCRGLEVGLIAQVNVNIDEHGAITKAELDPRSKAVNAAVKDAALAS
jgi:hypothetical protein